MASGSLSHDAGALWDWDSVLLLAHPPAAAAAALDSSQDHPPAAQDVDQQQQAQRRRRDPRMTCPNFLAGRVPCACSDEEADEEEEDRSQKRSKVAPRCQVPNCQSDLVALKGYHQRHRVCLTCANAASVFVRNQQQRYCQQCGKFHPLPDFDSGKRSCRRKLEKHNNRRRRSLKLPEAPRVPVREASITQSSDKDVVNPSNTNNNNSSDASDAGVVQRLPETPPGTNGSGSALYCFDQEQEQPAPNASFEHEDSYVFDASAVDESLLALMLEEQHDQISQQQLHNVKQQDASRLPEHVCPSVSSSGIKKHSASGIKKHSAYTSPCPTRRISFKFYDWNPADFPRRLREQILEWLGNMPVELEGYIRSGCTILTLYIAMPEQGWIKLYEDWNGHLVKLITGSEAGFWDKGFLSAFLDNKVAYIDHGCVSSPSPCEKVSRKYPVIETISPLCLETGKKARVIVSGRNLLELNSRLLVGSEGKYLPCYISSDTTRLQAEIVTPQRVGVVFIEMAYDYGISNFVPLLIADSELCEEVRTLEAPNLYCCCAEDSGNLQKLQEVYSVILDLGWVSRRAQDSRLTLPASSDSSDLRRLQALLLFAIQRGWRVTTERVLQAAHGMCLLDKLGLDRAQYLATAQNKPDICKVLEIFQLLNDKVNSHSEGNMHYSRSRPDLSMIRDLRIQLRYRKKNILKAAFGIAVACAGVCIVLQHPQQVREISTSLRRCLWYQQP